MNGTKNTSPVVLWISGLGHVPSFKNSKMIARGRLITHPKKRKFMDKATQSLRSQLKCLSATGGGAISTVPPAQSLTVLFRQLPKDDSWQWIPEIHVKGTKCKKGAEGARITVERIQ